jgi:hypothetical protein
MIEMRLITSPRLRGEVGTRAYARVPGEGRHIHLRKGPLTPSLSPQAGRGGALQSMRMEVA